MDININALYNILKQNQGDVNEEVGIKKKEVLEESDDEDTKDLKKITALVCKASGQERRWTKRDINKVMCYNCKNESHFAKDCKKEKVKDYNYFNTKMLLAKKDSDDQVLLVEEQAWMEMSSDSEEELSANMVFKAKMEKMIYDLEESSSSDKNTIAEVSYYSSDSKVNLNLMNLHIIMINCPGFPLDSRLGMFKAYDGDLVLGSMTIKKVYYVKCLGHNLFSVGQFCDMGLEVTFRKSTCFVRTKEGVDFLTGNHSLNLYTISLNDVASKSSVCVLADASSSQSWLWR
ncbi:integrase, catalytic region, zinc finger, CCHC-type containing protein [Tanacetum coccineum]